MEPLSYAETAYDSSNPRALKPAKSMEQRDLTTKQMLKHKVAPLPVECGEYLLLTELGDLDLVRKPESRKEVETMAPLQLGWFGGANPMYVAMIVKFIAGFCAFVCLFGGLIVFPILTPIVSPHSYSHAELISTILSLVKPGLVGGGISLVPYFILGYLLKHNKFSNKNNTMFNRRNGMVQMPLKTGHVRELRFDELEPYRYETISPNGALYYHLLFAHRYSDTFLTSPTRHMEPWKVNVEWEYYRQFMDVSKPLPDVPFTELHRALDPTTIAWDETMKRPKDFWINTTKATLANMMRESVAAARTFAWGSTRQQAKAAGWKPSLYGAQTYCDREPPKEKEDKKKTKHKHGQGKASDAAPA